MSNRDDLVVVDPGWAWDDKFSFVPAIRAGGFIYVSGQLALDPDGKLVGEGSIELQTRKIFQNIEEILKKADCSLDRIVRLTCYCLDFKEYAAFGRVRADLFKGKYPASTAIGVSSLLIPGALLEVDAIALA